jgi:hypothetical protein
VRCVRVKAEGFVLKVQWGVCDGAKERRSECGAVRVGTGNGQFECRVA